MKRSGILHRDLLHEIGRLGHGDLFAVADCGLPTPPGVSVVDLAVVKGLPSFLEVLDALRDELVIEAATAAEEAREHRIGEELFTRFNDLELIPHDDLKARSAQCRFIVRTGEARPYANVVLRAGVPF